MLIRSFRNNNSVNIEVVDSGPGISSEHIPHLFERFYRVPDQNANVRGTGLGLYICRKIIEAHEGEIGVESKPGAGTTFHITLPFSALEEQEDLEAEHG